MTKRLAALLLFAITAVPAVAGVGCPGGCPQPSAAGLQPQFTGLASGCRETAARTPCVRNETIQFSATDYHACGCGSAQPVYLWNFGDGGTSSLVSPTHSYGASGTYNVTLTVISTITDPPIVITVPLQVTVADAIPAMNGVALALLATALAVFAVVRMR